MSKSTQPQNHALPVFVTMCLRVSKNDPRQPLSSISALSQEPALPNFEKWHMKTICLNVPNQDFKTSTPVRLIDLDFSEKKLTKEMIPILKEEIFHALIKSTQLPFSFLDENEAVFFHNQHFEVLAGSKMTGFIENQFRLESPILKTKMETSLSSAQNTDKPFKHL